MTFPNRLLPWQQHQWEHLCSYIAQKRIPQALLITGNKGLGKQQLAHQFAAGLLCATPQASGTACGHCSSCLLVNADTHPDFIQIQPEEPGKGIGIGQIRSLIGRLTLKPQFETQRVVIVNPADKMNNAAANAFLKCLEEPTERTSIILITEKPAKLPATIISRCQKLAVVTPDKDVAVKWLAEIMQCDAATNKTLQLNVSLAQGAPLLALEYANDQTLTLRNECFDAWMAIAKQLKSPVIIAEDWHKLPASPLIFWITSWVIDLIKCFYQAQVANLYNPDLNEPLQELSRRLELKGLYKLYDLLLSDRQRLDTQINKQLLFEEILIQWYELNRSK
ncbi:MAG: DNA polymerase III subunit delta' [Methylobacter sp.]|uniref:DNA polymerase III subunit delta' n=1 Tax=Candidatus Methylobacter titanis TaxID=3053457 RepID=A0AA43Q5Y8_9GAMM|nr:DNA polymerase III subunit delta' [Candidatus Methylobacter titanis]MDI1293783.1 DNA polymerase III subunit delta' [Candidatus Methylobacter titanis]